MNENERLIQEANELPDQADLLEIRCPYDRISKSDEKLYRCNSLCVRNTPGSKGEARCRKCGLNFLYVVSLEAAVQTGVRIQPIA